MKVVSLSLTPGGQLLGNVILNSEESEKILLSMVDGKHSLGAGYVLEDGKKDCKEIYFAPASPSPIGCVCVGGPLDGKRVDSVFKRFTHREVSSVNYPDEQTQDLGVIDHEYRICEVFSEKTPHFIYLHVD